MYRRKILRTAMFTLLQVIAWALIIGIPFITAPQIPKTIPENVEEQFGELRITILIFTLLVMLYSYANYYLIYPRVLKRYGWWAYIGTTALMLVLIFILFAFAMTLLDIERKQFNVVLPIFPVSLFILVFAISTVVRFAIAQDEFERERKERENETLKSELSLLRSQVSPHFMFNVLNSLAALNRKKSDQLEHVIVQLSKLMRYMLYEKEDNAITVAMELEYLNSYINLQKIRFADDVLVTFHVDSKANAVAIEPMLLIPFVENAFKHGIGMILNPVIEMYFWGDNRTIRFLVRNKVNLHVESSKDSSHGIGLTNLRRRLNLLYKNRHEIKTVITEDNWYEAELKIYIHDELHSSRR